MSLESILQFFSGASKLPATGFDETPKITFTSENVLPYTSTCALKVTFPRSLGLLLMMTLRAKWNFASVVPLDLVPFSVTLCLYICVLTHRCVVVMLTSL